MSSTSEPDPTKVSNTPSKPSCTGINGVEYSWIIKFFSEEDVGKIIEDFVSDDKATRHFFAPSCAGKNIIQGSEEKCQDCRDYQVLIDSRIRSFMSGDFNAKLQTNWSVLDHDVPNPSNCCFQIIQNSLYALQIQPHEIHDVLDLIKSKIKSRQINVYMDSRTKKLFENIVVDCKNTVQKHVVLKDLVTVQSVMRGRLKRKRYNELREIYINTQVFQRNKIFRELVRKEGIYCKLLNTIVQDYIGGLREHALKRKPILTEPEIESIFGNIDSILEVHLKLYRHLMSLQTNWPNIDGIGQIFLRVAPSFKEYGKYVQHIILAINTLKLLQSQKEKFSNFLHQKGEATETELLNLLMMPLNHIGEYQSLLMRLMEVTPTTTSDYVHQPLAHAVMDETSKFIKKQLVMGDESPLDDIAKRIKKSPIKIEEDKRRKFLKEGPAQATTPDKPKRFQAYLFLFDDFLLICKGSVKPPYKFIMKVDLPATMMEIPKHTNTPNVPNRRSTVSQTMNLNLTFEGQKIVLSWTVLSEFRDWCTHLGDQIAIQQKKRVFGVNLAKIDLDFTDGLPTFVVLIIRHLYHNAMSTEGLFRIAGSQSVVTHLKDIIDKGLIRELRLSDYESVDLAALLKLYFREMLEPLIPYQLYDSLLEISNQYETSPSEMIDAIKGQTLTMPSLNYRLLEYLMFFLKKVSTYSDKNKMRAMNLAICFSPNLLRPKTETIEFSLNISKSNAIVEAMIENYDTIFKKNHEKDSRFDNTETKEVNTSSSVNASAFLTPSTPPLSTDESRESKKGTLQSIRARSQTGLNKLLHTLSPVPLQNLLTSSSSSQSAKTSRGLKNTSTPSSPVLPNISLSLSPSSTLPGGIPSLTSASIAAGSGSGPESQSPSLSRTPTTSNPSLLTSPPGSPHKKRERPLPPLPSPKKEADAVVIPSLVLSQLPIPLSYSDSGVSPPSTPLHLPASSDPIVVTDDCSSECSSSSVNPPTLSVTPSSPNVAPHKSSPRAELESEPVTQTEMKPDPEPEQNPEEPKEEKEEKEDTGPVPVPDKDVDRLSHPVSVPLVPVQPSKISVENEDPKSKKETKADVDSSAEGDFGSIDEDEGFEDDEFSVSDGSSSKGGSSVIFKIDKPDQPDQPDQPTNLVKPVTESELPEESTKPIDINSETSSVQNDDSFESFSHPVTPVTNRLRAKIDEDDDDDDEDDSGDDSE
eukprot:TRINITY_DN14812_c0_g1_i1.p1 TRINITY_DN14812_c0_g1~~TRINITY_DN14812_c0_g1_i1.p1  ORF type:complete len:1201 (+),score=290.37 TRINITY_DN14812_c0_g1_i1:68-3670(+)